MEVAALVEGVLNALVPYFQLSAKSFASTLGSRACAKVEQMLSELRGGGRDGELALERLERDPADSLVSVAEQMFLTLSNDPELAERLRALLGAGGPELNVSQDVREAHDIVAVEIESVQGGTIKVRQTIGKAVNVIGPKIGTFGRA